ncbi:MFS transporter [Actinoplanes sp. NPDC048796]|uniref:MFS transporter n=1 Tax=Actinoplanes sp. NPDC048796 TaxID=3155640 RepID=UPI0033D0F1A9
MDIHHATTLRPAPGAAPAPERSRWAALALLVTGLFMVSADVTIVNVALGAVRTDLHASGAVLELVVSGYTIAYAVLLITGARLGNLLGASRMFAGGLALFVAGSLVCGLAPTTVVLVIGRFVQGIGAAATVPQILSVVQQRFHGADRARALSVYGATMASGIIAGQVLGGLIVTADIGGLSWRPAFLLNVPVGLVVLALIPRHLRGGGTSRGRRLDVPGLVTGSAGLLLIVLPLVLGREQGWPAWSFAAILAGALVLGGFVVIELRVAAGGGDPLLDLQVLRSPGMAAGVAALAAGMIAYGGFLFTVSLHLQSALGDSALHVGLFFAPMAVAFGALGYAWRLFPPTWHAWVPVVGAPTAGAGYLLTAWALRGGGQSPLALVPVMVLTGAATGVSFSPLLTQSLVQVPVDRAADAGGILATTQQLAQVIGVTVLGGFYLGRVQAGHLPGPAVAGVLGGCALVAALGVGGGVALSRVVRRAG